MITNEEIIAKLETQIKELEKLRIRILKNNKPEPQKLRLIKFKNKKIES